MTDIKKPSNLNQPKSVGINPSRYVSSYNKGINKDVHTSMSKNKNNTKTDVNILLIVVIILGIIGVILVILHFEIDLFKKKEEESSDPNNEGDSEIVEQKPEVFLVEEDNNGGKFKSADAEKICTGLDSKLATYTQLLDAVNKGGEWCTYGWINDKGTIDGYMPNKDSKCILDNSKSIAGPFQDIDKNNDELSVNCYGIKPDMDSEFIKLYNDAQEIKAQTIKDDAAAKKAFSDKIKNVNVSPFNPTNWSIEKPNADYFGNKLCDTLTKQC
jgi:hypothetical protein